MPARLPSIWLSKCCIHTNLNVPAFPFCPTFEPPFQTVSALVVVVFKVNDPSTWLLRGSYIVLSGKTSDEMKAMLVVLVLCSVEV